MDVIACALLNAVQLCFVVIVTLGPAVMRNTNLRNNGAWLPRAEFVRRRDIMVEALSAKVESDNNPMAALTDPSMMMQQQKSMVS